MDRRLPHDVVDLASDGSNPRFRKLPVTPDTPVSDFLPARNAVLTMLASKPASASCCRTGRAKGSGTIRGAITEAFAANSNAPGRY